MAKSNVNALVSYKFTREINVFPTEDNLNQFEFLDCGKHRIQSFGWAKNGEGNFITTLENGDVVLRFRSQKKSPSKPEIERRVKAKVKIKEEELQRPLNKKDIKLLMASTLEEILPETFPANPVDQLVLITSVGDTKVVLVGAGSYKAAEDILGLLRKSIGSLPVVPVDLNVLPDEFMTDFVASRNESKPTHKFTLLENVKLEDPDGFQIGVGKGSVYDADIDDHLKKGAQVVQLDMNYDGIASMKLDSEGVLKGIKFSNDLKEFEDAENAETKLDQEATDLITLMYAKELYTALVEACEGIQS